MKSERRHELATNELADWVVHFPQWFRENQTTVIATAIIVVGLIVYTIFFYSRRSRAEEQKESMAVTILDQLSWQKETVLEGKVQGLGVSDVFLGMAGSLGNVAVETENPVLSALAMIKRAEALRTELHYRSSIAEPDVRKNQLEQAAKIYEQAMEKAKGQPAIAAMAEYGIALCLEDMRNFAEAEKLYNKIAASVEYQSSSFPVRAELRLKTLEDKKEKVLFVQTEPQPMPDIQKPGPLMLEAPLTIEQMAAQKDLDFNSSRTGELLNRKMVRDSNK
jgi:tetratricopeptide (TPR) repeat protein